MKNIYTGCLLMASALTMTSCYDEYTGDFEFSAAYFASQKPLRTVIADRDMTIKVGVAIGGKMAVDKNDYAHFEIDTALLHNTGFTLLPESYYTLSHNDKMTVSNANVAVADVKVSFTEDFYNDEAAIGKHYALPFRVYDSSLDSILTAKSTSIVAIKYQNAYHGNYYTRGTIYEVAADQTTSHVTSYWNHDISQNKAYTLTTLDRNTLLRPDIKAYAGSLSYATGAVNLEFAEGKIELTAGEGNTSFVEGSGKASYGYNKNSDNRLELFLEYKFTNNGKTYKVIEELYRRQDPLKDLRFEEW